MRSVSSSHADLRQSMVATQIRDRGVRDPRVLAALERVPRHEFVNIAPALAYSDHPLSIGGGQTISQPYIVGYMTELLELEPHHKVLEIGTGSGYQTAVLAEIVRDVRTVEVIGELSRLASETLARLGYGNVTCRVANGWEGWPEEAPFDRIIVTAAPGEVPAALKEQLAPNGVLVVPVGNFDQRIIRVERTGDSPARFTEEELLPVRFVPMVR